MKENNDVALTLFLRGIRSMALKYTQVRVVNEDVALDILQDTMMGFVQAVDRYEKDAWKNLFFKILNRRITDRLRKQAWRNRLAQMLTFSQLAGDQEEQPPEPEFIGVSNTDASVEVQRLALQFESALANLPVRQQEAYLFRQWQGMSVSETAEIMNCSPGTVKTHLSRAMQSLREQLGEWINDET